MLSNDVAVALKNLPDSHKYEATQNLCYWTDRLFDCLNVRSYAQARRKCKADLYPYTSVGDSRFPLMLKCLEYFDAWKARVWKFATKAERCKSFLASQTHVGLKITVHSSIELCKYLIEVEGAESVYTSCFNQDPLESYFSMVRNYGGCKNPTVKRTTEAMDVIRELRVVKPGKGANTMEAYLAE